MNFYHLTLREIIDLFEAAPCNLKVSFKLGQYQDNDVSEWLP